MGIIKFFKKLLNISMPKGMVSFTMFTCEDLSKKLIFEKEAGFIARSKMKMHLSICGACKAYSAQMALIDKSYRDKIQKIESKIDQKRVKQLESEVIDRALKKK